MCVWQRRFNDVFSHRTIYAGRTQFVDGSVLRQNDLRARLICTACVCGFCRVPMIFFESLPMTPIVVFSDKCKVQLPTLHLRRPSHMLVCACVQEIFAALGRARLRTVIVRTSSSSSSLCSCNNYFLAFACRSDLIVRFE